MVAFESVMDQELMTVGSNNPAWIDLIKQIYACLQNVPCSNSFLHPDSCFQGVALNAMLEFFRCLVAAKVPGLGQKDLLALLVNPVLQQQGAAIHKQV